MNTVLCKTIGLLCGVVLATTTVLADASNLDSLRKALSDGEFETAKELATTLVESEDVSSEAYFVLGKAEFGLTDYDASIAAFSEAIKLEPDNAAAYSERGLARTFKGMGMNMFAAGPVYMRSLEDYKKAVAIDPDMISAHIGLTRYYSNAPAIGGGSMKKAKEHAAEVLRINPHRGYIERGLIAQKEGRFEDAISDLGEALAIDANDVEAQFELGRSLQMAGRNDEAKAAYEKTLALYEGHEGAAKALASLE